MKRIKKVSATTPTTAQVVNTYSESQTEAYSADYVNGLNTYLETEQRIGTWINGKPIYRKVIHLTSSWQLNAEKIIGHNIANVDEIWLERAYFKRSDNTYQMIPNVHSDIANWGAGIYNLSAIEFVLWFGKMANFFTINYVDVILQYTKTTDPTPSL